MQLINWKVEGMDCSNCALSINKVLQKQGMQNISVNPISGEVSFEVTDADGSVEKAARNIEALGYSVNTEEKHAVVSKQKFSGTLMQLFWICLPFTLLLMLGHWTMTFGIHFLHNGWLQLFLCLPVYVIGMSYFGKRAVNSLRSGVPNMHVLIALGATSAFIYSLVGLLTADPSKLFFETAASIINIVLLGEWLEDMTVKKTQQTIKELTRTDKVTANMIAYDDQHNENIFTVESEHLQVGDLLLIKAGEQVPIDCKILSGQAEVNEAIITGESLPVLRNQNDILIGGSLLVSGTVKAYVSATGNDTVLSSLVRLVNRAQNYKPPVQRLADRISAIFVPAVIGIALLAWCINYFALGNSLQESLMRSIAVLVIACPCAMGLATPAAIAVGLGRAAKEGILFTDSKSMELFDTIRQVVFDKTGTLTTGNFSIKNYHTVIEREEFKSLVVSLEKYSNHPIAKSIVLAWKTSLPFKLRKPTEIKGVGMEAVDKDGNLFFVGSKTNLSAELAGHSLYVTKNSEVIGWLDIEDEIRTEAFEVVRFCKDSGMRTILLSGDNVSKTRQVADALNIDEVLAEKTPAQKLKIIEDLTSTEPTMMVGDGINDAPALAKATLSISLSDASKLAIQSSSVILMSSGLKKLPEAVLLGKKTYSTIKGNLFWAFFYNILAIPVAAAGLLTPTAGALVMGLSDVVLAANSLALRWRKI